MPIERRWSNEWGVMRAGRLIQLMRELQGGDRFTVDQLAERLEVSPRTVLRDLDTLIGAGVSVITTRGRNGGVHLAESTQASPGLAPGFGGASAGRLCRVRVRLSPAAHRQAMASGRPEGWRARPNPDPPHPDRDDWIEGSFRFGSYNEAPGELLVLGGGVEVLLPTHVRVAMATIARSIVLLHQPLDPQHEDRGMPAARTGQDIALRND